MTNTTPDQSRTPELPEPAAWKFLHADQIKLQPVYTAGQLHEYGRACVAAALLQGCGACHDKCEDRGGECRLEAESPMPELTPKEALQALSENAQELGLDYVPAPTPLAAQCTQGDPQ